MYKINMIGVLLIPGPRPIDLFAIRKGTGESATHSGSLGNSRNRGIPTASVINVGLACRSHLPANSSQFRFICTFQDLHQTCLVW